nr:FAD-dependent oxidoreductase [Stenotrophomonas maltophilia]
MPHTPSAYDHDVVIVGASFAGAACALAAAQYGLRVCVLERKAEPGERLHTTGIVVKEAMEQTWLGRMPEQFLQRVANVRLYAPNLRSVLLAAPDALAGQRAAREWCRPAPAAVLHRRTSLW